jgi:hypothetical protein
MWKEFNSNASEHSIPPKQSIWSSSIDEESAWIEAVHSLASTRRNQHYTCGSSDSTVIEGTEIPKIIHFIWLGPNPIPRYSFLSDVPEHCAIKTTENKGWNECMMSWKKYHPSKMGWAVHLWICDNIKDKAVTNQSLDANNFELSQMHNSAGFQHAMTIKQYGLASDILRLEILNVFGGVYVDVDYLCVRSLQSLISNNIIDETKTRVAPLQFFCGESNTGCLELNNGILACRRHGHSIIREMMQSVHGYCERLLLESNVTPSRNDSLNAMLSPFLDAETWNAMQKSQKVTSSPTPMSVIEHTGPGLLTRTVCRWLCNGGRVELCVQKEDAGDACGMQNDYDSTNLDASQVMVFHRDVFHPFPNHLRHDVATRLRGFIVPDVTIAVHLWGCSWQSN